MAVCDLTIDVGSQPLNPDTHIPLMKMLYNDKVLEDKFDEAGSLNFFNPEVDGRWTNDLSVHHSIRLRFKEYRNPFTSVGVTEVEYQDDQSCPPVLESQCDPGCVGTENAWRTLDVRFKNKMRVGAQWCVEEERLLFQDAEQRFAESVEDAAVVKSTYGWSELVCQAIDSPAETLLPRFRGVFPTHYFDAGSADQVTVITQVFNYMQRIYNRRWGSEFAVIADPQLELDLASVATSSWHNYNNTGIPTAQVNDDVFVAGGFRPMQLLPKAWGKPIYIAPDTVSYYPGAGTGDLNGLNLNPFQNSDGSKYYVVIASKRAFFHGAAPMMDKHYFPATCDNKYAAIQQTWLTFYQLLFPNEVFVIAFDQDSGFSS